MATETLPPLPDLESNLESTMDSFSNSDQELHVLAVDDSLIDRKVIERLLKISCCKVTAVDSGRRALQYLGLDGEENSVGFNVSKVNMIITDYWMPGMTGYELMKTIKKSSAFKEIPVVIMSSENVLPRINRCLEDGAEEFIVKPVKLSDVRRLKDHLLREEVDEIRGTLKRKLEETDDVSISSAPSTPLDMDSSSISSSPSSSIDMSPSSSSSSSSSQSSTPTDSMSPSSSPSRRMKMSSYCD